MLQDVPAQQQADGPKEMEVHPDIRLCGAGPALTRRHQLQPVRTYCCVSFQPCTILMYPAGQVAADVCQSLSKPAETSSVSRKP